ncbi:hypothetical protein [Leifsonia shinshuensis]|uniref:Uncharacterized protein n=2 Tax=Leifsonia shinshuensis TaxID=150026 RepID=A0A853CV96_9MICO|nr:hypothetical protein [Leifsonia shinshuensis]
MIERARALSTTIAAFALAIGLAGCSTLPDHGATATGGVACLNLRSTVTNLEALRAWCLDHNDAAGAAAWATGIENSLKTAAVGDTAATSRVRAAASRLDEQVRLLSGSDSRSAIAQLPDVITGIVDELKPAGDAVCA